MTQLRPQGTRDHHQGRQEGEVRRRQRHSAAAGRRDRGQGRRHAGRLGAGQSGDDAVEGQRRHLRARRRDGCGRNAEVGVLGQQPGQGGGQHDPRRRRQEGEVPGALSQYLLVAGRAGRLRQGRRQLCGQGRQIRSQPAASSRRRARMPACANRTIAESIGWYDGIIADMFAKTAKPAAAAPAAPAKKG